MKKIGLLLLVLAALFFLSNCGAGSSGATTLSTPSTPPISVEYLDGAGDVALDSSFEATFSQAVDTDTVNTSTFFVVATASANADIASPIKAAVYDSTICNSANALAATVTCTTSTTCTLDTTSDLTSGTQYTACLVPGAGSAGSGTGIFYADGTAYSGLRATFTTFGATPTLIDGKGNSISAGTTGLTGIFASSFRLIFSEAMDPATVTTSNVIYTCQGATPTFSIARVLHADDPTVQSDRTFDITITDPYLYQITNCTFDITTSVKTAAGTAVSAANYAFKTGCAISDTFSANTSECWTVSTAAGVTWSTWPDLLANILMFDGSDLGYSTVGQTEYTVVRIYKNVTFSRAGFELVFGVDDPALLTGFHLETQNLSLNLWNPDRTVTVAIVMHIIDTQFLDAAFTNSLTAEADDGDAFINNMPQDGSYIIRLSADTTNGMTANYKRNNGETTALAPMGAPLPTADEIVNSLLQYAGETWELSIRFWSDPNATATITSVVTTGISSATQY